MSRGIKLTALTVLLATVLLALALELAPFWETVSLEARVVAGPGAVKKRIATMKRIELKNTSNHPFWIRVNDVSGKGIRAPGQSFTLHATYIGNPRPFRADLGVMLKAHQTLSMWLRDSEHLAMEDFALEVDCVATPATDSFLVNKYEYFCTHGPKFMRSAPTIIKTQSATFPVAPAKP